MFEHIYLIVWKLVLTKTCVTLGNLTP